MATVDENSDGVEVLEGLESFDKLAIRSENREYNSYESNSSTASNSDDNEVSQLKKRSSANITLAPRKLRPDYQQRTRSNYHSQATYAFLPRSAEKTDDNDLDENGERRNKPWMTQEILDLIETRNQIFQKMTTFERDSPEGLKHYAEYKAVRNTVNTLTRQAKKVYRNILRPTIETEIKKHLRGIIRTQTRGTYRQMTSHMHVQPWQMSTAEYASYKKNIVPTRYAHNSSMESWRRSTCVNTASITMNTNSRPSIYTPRKLSCDSALDE